MNYLLDKKNKKRKTSKIIFGVFILFLVIYFHAGIFRGLSSTFSFIFRPVIILGKNIGGGISNAGSIFHTRRTLTEENETLQAEISASAVDRANYASVLDENIQMKEILGRKPQNVSMILAGILEKPNVSPYDTLVIDAGKDEGIVVGQNVFALGNVPIGKITEVDTNSSKVILFSNPGEKTEVVISGQNVFMEAVGRGGGNFEMILPRDFVLPVGTEVDLPGVTPHILGTVATILSDPRDAYQKALLASPINIWQQKFVEVEK